jgi:hypothetical protein
MANTQAMCTSFKGELLTATHNFGTAPVRAATTADTFKAALYLASATINATTTVYTTTGEVTGTNYTAGGVTVTNATAPTTSGTTGYWTPSASITYGSSGSPVTLSTAFDCVLIYNSTQSNKSVSVHTFGSQTITAGTFALTMPTNDATNALIRLA